MSFNFFIGQYEIVLHETSLWDEKVDDQWSKKSSSKFVLVRQRRQMTGVKWQKTPERIQGVYGRLGYGG